MESRAVSPLAGLSLDIRLALRMVRRQPGFAFVSIALIALAIAAATSIFSVVNGVIFKPLPRVKMDGLVRVFDSGPGNEPVTALTNSTYFAWRDSPSTIEGLAAWDDWSVASEGASGLSWFVAARSRRACFR
jgi:hypothetical protein